MSSIAYQYDQPSHKLLKRWFEEMIMGEHPAEMKIDEI
jgi:hypothetical protein